MTANITSPFPKSKKLKAHLVMKKTKALTLGLLWHSPNSDNLGVGALTASQIVILTQVVDELGLEAKFRILCWKDPGKHYVSGPKVEVVTLRGRDLLRPGGLFSAVRGCDIVLDISAGDSFADIYGAKRFLFNFIAKANVLAARRPLVLSPQTIGPFQRWWTKRLAKQVMRGARKVVTRDALSSNYLREMGLGDMLVEATDVAFRLPFEKPVPRNEKPVRVGLNVSGLLYNGGYSQDNMFSLSADYKTLVQSLCEYFTSLPDTELHLVGHVNSRTQEIEDDYRVAERLALQFPSAIVAPRFESPSDAKTYIANLDFFAGSRMHACIAAFSSGVPVLPIAYSRKFAGLFGTLGYQHLSDCKTQNANEILAEVKTAFEHRSELEAEVEKACIQANRKLNAYFELLRHLFKDIACQD